VIIPDCGHWITEEQPQATTDLVVDFLRRPRSYVAYGELSALFSTVPTG
jgi:hypothetical protein